MMAQWRGIGPHETWVYTRSMGGISLAEEFAGLGDEFSFGTFTPAAEPHANL